jgi:WD40 repeat protein/transcriptional regulator with XRE-family HTH domain
VKKSSYREPDYAFGQLMLTLRMAIGLTQAGLADHLGVSRNAVGGWEVGQSYPKAEHLKAFIALGLQQQVFASGREAEEIRALWRAAHQKVLLDEPWLQDLLNQHAPPQEPDLNLQTPDTDVLDISQVSGKPQVDWGEALDVPTFFGREEELALLSHWVVEERCRVVSVLGMGGIGKSALAVTVMHRVARQFEVVLWRSLRNALSCDALVEECLQVLAPQRLHGLPVSLDARLRLLMEQLRVRRVLLVLDNVETLLEEGTGRMPIGTQGYGDLLRQIAQTSHQSCLLLTSREKPADLVPLEGSRSPVRALRLAGLDGRAGARLLAEKDVVGSPQDRERLVEEYRGNPLALKIVAQTIVELFGGEVVPFLEQSEVVFGGVRELLDEQFDRLSVLEQTTLCWLAILREPIRLEGLLAVLSTPMTSTQVLEALDRLGRRSLIERGQRAGSFMLQSVVLEYVTARLIALGSREIEQGHLAYLIAYGLYHAQTKDFVRAIQEHLLVVPLLSRLQSTYPGHADLETRLLSLLDQLRGLPQASQGYGPANLVALLYMLRGDLRGLDLSGLVLRGVYLQGVEMQDTLLSEATLLESVFTSPFDAIAAVATSKSGQYWAAASRRGEVKIWVEAGQTLSMAWQAHSATITALAFSPDGHQLATGGWDATVKLWDVESGTLLWTGWHTGGIDCVAFAPDGRLLASGGNDTLVQLWDPRSGVKVRTLAAQGGTVCSLAWGPDGRLLTSGCSDGSIWVWQFEGLESDTHAQRLSEHTDLVTGLSFAPDGSQFASASFDGTVKLWDTESFDCLQTLSEHTDRAMRVAWSPDGHILASCSFDRTICLWEVREDRSRAILYGHSAAIYAIAFTSDSRNLLSGSYDGTLLVWDVESGQRLHRIEGYAASLFDLDWSPDGRLLASGGADTLVTLWDRASATSPKVLRGHRWIVPGVAWSPDGRLLVSAGYDNRIGLWDPATGVCLQVLKDPDAADTIFLGVAWSPDGRLLACGSYLRGVQVWDMTSYTRFWVGRTQPTLLRRIAWSSDGTRLVGGGDDGLIYVWHATDGTLLLQLKGHEGAVMNVAWSPDGRWLASAGGGRKGGELIVWDAQSGEWVQTFAGHSGVSFAVAWSPSGELLISGSGDGFLRWWDIQSGHCVREQKAHQGTVQALKVSPDGSILASCGDDGAILLWDIENGELQHTMRRDRPYERLNITGIRGLSEAQKSSLYALGAFEESNVGA